MEFVRRRRARLWRRIWFLELIMSFDTSKTTKLLFACLDWRLHPAIANYFAKEGVACDMCITAGSLKGLIDPATRDFFLKQIEVSKNLHQCREVVLTMHMDCGAYGGAAAFGGAEEEIACYKEELRKAKQIINENFSDLIVSAWLIDLKKDAADWKIFPELINI